MMMEESMCVGGWCGNQLEMDGVSSDLKQANLNRSNFVKHKSSVSEPAFQKKILA